MKCATRLLETVPEAVEKSRIDSECLVESFSAAQELALEMPLA